MPISYSYIYISYKYITYNSYFSCVANLTQAACLLFNRVSKGNIRDLDRGLFILFD